MPQVLQGQLFLTPNATRIPYQLANNQSSVVGVFVDQDVDWGNAAWEERFAGARGTLGARRSGSEVKNRQVQVPLHVMGSTKDNLAFRVEELLEQAELMRRTGGLITWQSAGQTYRQHLEALSFAYESAPWSNEAEGLYRHAIRLRAVCGPYVLGDSMDVAERFDYTTTTLPLYYSADSGAVANLTPSGGRLVAAANLTTENVLIYQGNGYLMGDVQVTARFQPSATITNFKGGVVIRRTGATTRWVAYVDDNGTNSRLRIDKVVSGVTTNVATLNLAARITANAPFWIRGRVEGTAFYAEYHTKPLQAFESTLPSGLQTVRYTALPSESGVAQAGEGLAGLLFTPQAAGASVSDFRIEPYWYTGQYSTVLSSLPVNVKCHGVIPGRAPAIGRLVATKDAASTPAKSFVFGWRDRPLPYNIAADGGSTVKFWGVAAVTGVTGAASSVAAATGPKGFRAARITTTAAANIGGTLRLPEPFVPGRTYAAIAWLSSAASTHLARIRLGVNGDIASSTAQTLSVAAKLHACTWTPTTGAPSGPAYLAAEQTAATAGTIDIEGAQVWEIEPGVPTGTVAAGDTTIALNRIPTAWPPVPFIAAAINQTSGHELVYVSAISGTTLTVARGVEGTTAVAHTGGQMMLAPLPENHGVMSFAGRPGHPPLGPVPPSEVTDLGAITTVPTGNYLGGLGIETVVASASAFATIIEGRYYIDPALFELDPDGDGRSMDVEVYAQIRTSNNAFTGLVGVLTWGPYGATTRELLTVPIEFGASSAIDGIFRLGVVNVNQAFGGYITLRIDGAITAAAALGIGQLYLFPVSSRVATPSGVPSAGYPEFMSGAIDAATVGDKRKEVDPDLVGRYRSGVAPTALLDTNPAADIALDNHHPVGGSMIELPAGIRPPALAALAKAEIIDDTSSLGGVEGLPQRVGVHLEVTPRYYLMRI